MTEITNIIHERVDDIPLIIGLAQRLGLPEIIDKNIGNHGLHQGLSNGLLTTVWLSYILSEGDHRKYSVQDWANKHSQTLEKLLGQPIREVELGDDRLGVVLRRLGKRTAWEGLEADLWSNTVAVYEIQITGIRLDSTTASGYHTSTEDGIMQYGHSKDHRPDLVQLKLMGAAAEPSGLMLTCDVLSGNKADDPLYTPALVRVRQMLGRSGLLYVGDSKMASLGTRSDIVANDDYYLMPLPMTGETGEKMDDWIGKVVDGNQTAELIWDENNLLGGGYEFQRILKATLDDRQIQWPERVQVYRSLSLASQQSHQLEEKVNKAKVELLALTPPPGRGKRKYSDEADLQKAVSGILEKHKVTGLLKVTWECHEEIVTRYIGRGRGGINRRKETEVSRRYFIKEVERDNAAIFRHQNRLGWRVQVTNMPVEQMSLSEAVIHYRGGWSIERDFHILKDRPLGIRPLYVRRDDQIVGLTCLLTLALRMLTLIETQVRGGLLEAGEHLTGLYAGQPSRKVDSPTGVLLLKAFARDEVTLTCINMGGKQYWHITFLSRLQEQILMHLKLSVSLYTNLIENSS
ncbi:MAG: IS1634 family transposase [Alphaproteobacteria bacterium]|nr:MAG: IS1634 family transposase [Alphaproteobacteria bacterium]